MFFQIVFNGVFEHVFFSDAGSLLHSERAMFRSEFCLVAFLRNGVVSLVFPNTGIGEKIINFIQIFRTHVIDILQYNTIRALIKFSHAGSQSKVLKLLRDI